MSGAGYVINYIEADQVLLRRLVQELLCFCPTASVTLIYDHAGLKRDFSGKWTAQWLAAGISLGADPIVKLDPDTRMWRAPEHFPNADYFGTISKERWFIRGGAVGVSRKAAQRLLESNLLDEPSSQSYQRYGRFRHPHETVDPTLISCQDRILGSACSRLDIQPHSWTEVNILARGNPDTAGFSMTHPHPTL